MTAPAAARVRPACISCLRLIDALRDCVGAFAAYPCGCWHTPEQARAIVRHARAASAAAGEPV